MSNTTRDPDPSTSTPGAPRRPRRRRSATTRLVVVSVACAGAVTSALAFFALPHLAADGALPWSPWLVLGTALISTALLAGYLIALVRSEARIRAILDNANLGVVFLAANGTVTGMNAAAEALFGRAEEALAGESFLAELVAPGSRTELALRLQHGAHAAGVQNAEVSGLRDGKPFPMECGVSVEGSGPGARTCVFVRDLTASRKLELELREALKLEAVGRLAAGIAHEINTPTQFIGDNTQFLAEAFTALSSVVERQRALLSPEARAALRPEEEALELDYLIEEVPQTIDRTLKGVKRVGTIVRAMKEFAHPDQREMNAADLNRAVQATLEVARNEYKYVADVETTLGDIPPVVCHAGEVNQVVLNLVVNAAHAIGDVVEKTQRKGTIRVGTRREGEHVLITVADTGGGIPEAVRDRIFEPFFTTKEVGRGTGQGLSIARSIVQKHHGTIDFHTEPGRGTIFTVRLPLDGSRPPAT